MFFYVFFYILHSVTTVLGAGLYVHQGSASTHQLYGIVQLLFSRSQIQNKVLVSWKTSCLALLSKHCLYLKPEWLYTLIKIVIIGVGVKDAIMINLT